MPRKAWLTTALLLSPCGCSSLLSSSSGSSTPAPTAILVDPSAFVGGVTCGDGAGELQRYVATLVDVTVFADAGKAAALASSPPTPCFEQVLFENVVAGHQYEAVIDGYDTSDIHPVAASSGDADVADAGQAGPPKVGSSTMANRAGSVVLPKWGATCGASDAILADGGTDAGDAGRNPISDASIGVYGGCRAQLLPDARASGDLTGPVCAFETLTIPMRHCTPLKPR